MMNLKTITAFCAFAASALFIQPAAAQHEGCQDHDHHEDVAGWLIDLNTHETNIDPAELAAPSAPAKPSSAVTRTAVGPARHARQQPTGSLTGKIVYTGAGHGWTYDDTTPGSGLVWFTQRGNNNDVVEDYGNQSQMTLFADYCWNAGATVVPTRPVGYQSNEVVLDQSDATYTGSWSNSTGNPYWSNTAFGVSDTVHYTFATAVVGSETATARYTPTIPEAGRYPVYTWVFNSSNRINQLYRIQHAEGQTEVRVNHRRVGKGWVWLGTYYFNAGTSGYLEISNHAESGETGTSVIADGIRFGNGMGDLDFGEGVSGFPREEEASRYWAEISAGKNSSGNQDMPGIWNPSSSHQNDNVSTPIRLVAYMNNESEGSEEDRIYISFHSNAGGGQGADGLINSSVSNRGPNASTLADFLGREINEDMRQLDTILFPSYTQWTNTTGHTFTGSITFGEMNYNTINQEMDPIIIEVAFHDSATDTQYLRDNKARRLIARATYQGMIRHFEDVDSSSLTMVPDEPTNLQALNTTDGSGDVVLTWEVPVERVSGEAGTPGNIGGDSPTGYNIYVSTGSDGEEFDFSTSVAGGATTSHTITGLPAGTTVFAMVTATNAGGESFPSNVAGARVHGNRPPILIVDGFDRDSNSTTLRRTITGISGRSDLSTFRRIDPSRSNDYSYVQEAGSAVAGGTVIRSFDYAPNDRIIDGSIALTDYEAIIWITGEESTVDETFDSTEQTRVTAALAAGVDLFVSGAEIAWDLDNLGSGADQTFFSGQLHAAYVGDDAATYNVNGPSGLTGDFAVFNGLSSFSFDDGTGDDYDAEFPDRLNTSGAGSQIIMDYSGGTGDGAAIAYDGSGAVAGKTVLLGFPFETITTSTARNEVMDAVLTFFGTPVPVELSGLELE